MGKKIKTYGMALAAVLSVSGLTAMAVPARRGVQEVMQPDGTTLRVSRMGDERCHFLVTEDGLLLTQTPDGVYRYATVDAAGRLESTGMRAVDAAMRPALPAGACNIRDLDVKSLASAAGRRRLPQTGMGLDKTTFPSKGTPHVLILLVQYQDVSFTLENPHEYFEGMLNEEGFSQYGGTGSCKDYFRENSNGVFVPSFDLYGPVTLPNPRNYYGGNDAYGTDRHPEEMVVDAIKILDDEVDFSIYDNDGDGVLDNVYVIYAGQGEASYGPPASVWPHSWDLSLAGVDLTVDGVKVDHYACSNEWQRDRPDGIGTFVHEFSHVMGLPDLYHTTAQSSADYTPKAYSVLDSGPYNNDGRTPPAYGIYERNAMGWIEPEVIDAPMDCELTHILKTNKGYLIPTSSDKEFFLLENRQQEGWDAYIPGHGMLVWHIDYNETQWAANTVNNDASHQYVDIVEACGETGSSVVVQAQYPFPGTQGVTSLTDETTPSLLSWSGEPTGMPLTDITETDGVIRFLADGGSANTRPRVPVPVEDVEKGDGYFVAAWSAVDKAVGYEVSVYAAGQGSPVTYTCDMGSGQTLKLPYGWTSSTTAVYNTSANYGASSPSLRMDATGVYLQSPVYDDDVSAVRYWRKGQHTEGSVLTVSGLVDGAWVVISTDDPSEESLKTVTLDEIPAGVRQVRFEYTKGTGNLALDDVEITAGNADVPLEPYVDYPVGDNTSLRVDRLLDGCDRYSFKVRACGVDNNSAYSRLVTVDLSDVSVGSVAADAGEVTYYDMLGRRVLRPAAGDILVERRGQTARKVVVR